MTFKTPLTDEVMPHAVGSGECFDCGHTWVAVWPLGASALECPSCGSRETDRHEIQE